MKAAQQHNKRFRDRELQLDIQTVQRNKNTLNSPLKVAFSNEEECSLQKLNNGSLEKNKKVKNEEYGNLLKQQMTLTRIEDENMLSKSRKLDVQNANYLKENYPFGFEGVRVCEGVIEKYKASNYSIQKNMLEKFEREAQEFRRNRIKKYQRSPNTQKRPYVQMRTTQPVKPIDNLSLITINQQQSKRQSQLELELLRIKQRQEEQKRRRKEYERELRRQRRNDVYLKREKENLIKVGNMLREIDHKLKENSSKLSSDLQELRNQLKSTPKFKKVNEQHLFNIVNKISENTQSCSKIPVIMYNSNLSDARLYYDDSSHIATRINRKEFNNSTTNIKEVLHILRKNENRLKLLTESYPTQDDYSDTRSH